MNKKAVIATIKFWLCIFVGACGIALLVNFPNIVGPIVILLIFAMISFIVYSINERGY